MAPFRARDDALAVEGLKPLQTAFKRLEGRIDADLRGELRIIARGVARRAISGVTHRTGRHGDPHLPHLEATIRETATTTGASVYTTSPYGMVQDRGGRVGHGAVIKRENASEYLTHAVRESRADIETKLGVVLDRLGAEFER